eukprot:g52536.t1
MSKRKGKAKKKVLVEDSSSSDEELINKKSDKKDKGRVRRAGSKQSIGSKQSQGSKQSAGEQDNNAQENGEDSSREENEEEDEKVEAQEEQDKEEEDEESEEEEEEDEEEQDNQQEEDGALAVRNDVRFAVLLNFIEVFRQANLFQGMAPYLIKELEEEILDPNGVQAQMRQLLPALLWRILSPRKGRELSATISDNPQGWQSLLEAQLLKRHTERFHTNPLADRTFLELSPSVRLQVLDAICLWSMEDQPDCKSFAARATPAALRYFPMGHDSQGCSYWRVSGDWWLFRRAPQPDTKKKKKKKKKAKKVANGEAEKNKVEGEEEKEEQEEGKSKKKKGKKQKEEEESLLFQDERDALEAPGSWAAVSTCKEEMQALLESLGQSTYPRSAEHKALLEKLKEHFEELNSKDDKEARALARKAHLALLPRKRSGRIQKLKADQEEKEKLDSIRKAKERKEAEARAREARARREAQEQAEMEEEEEEEEEARDHTASQYMPDGVTLTGVFEAAGRSKRGRTLRTRANLSMPPKKRRRDSHSSASHKHDAHMAGPPSPSAAGPAHEEGHPDQQTEDQQDQATQAGADLLAAFATQALQSPHKAELAVAPAAGGFWQQERGAQQQQQQSGEHTAQPPPHGYHLLTPSTAKPPLKWPGQQHSGRVQPAAGPAQRAARQSPEPRYSEEFALAAQNADFPAVGRPAHLAAQQQQYAAAAGGGGGNVQYSSQQQQPTGVTMATSLRTTAPGAHDRAPRNMSVSGQFGSGVAAVAAAPLSSMQASREAMARPVGSGHGAYGGGASRLPEQQLAGRPGYGASWARAASSEAESYVNYPPPRAQSPAAAAVTPTANVNYQAARNVPRETAAPRAQLTSQAQASNGVMYSAPRSMFGQELQQPQRPVSLANTQHMGAPLWQQLRLLPVNDKATLSYGAKKQQAKTCGDILQRIEGDALVTGSYLQTDYEAICSEVGPDSATPTNVVAPLRRCRTPVQVCRLLLTSMPEKGLNWPNHRDICKDRAIAHDSVSALSIFFVLGRRHLRAEFGRAARFCVFLSVFGDGWSVPPWHPPDSAP